jgi:endonuclease G, mitochondrial
MAQFRTNHAKSGGPSGNIIKMGLFAAILSGMFLVFNFFTGKGDADTPAQTGAGDARSNAERPDFLPLSSTGQVIDHQYFWLSYDEEHEQAEWVAYVLTKEQLDMPWVERQGDFRPDAKVKTSSATPNDYRNSGYDRGHLVPAADMAWDADAMRSTFVMSNISPQARNFNNGIWRELEELTRSWAKTCKKLYVVSGPVLSQPPKGTIGANEVSIPTAFYKVVLDAESSNPKAIGFIIPNEISFEPLTKFAVSVDEVERVTGLNFFANLLDKDTEMKLESRYNIDLWQFSKQKFQQRIDDWNKQ